MGTQVLLSLPRIMFHSQSNSVCNVYCLWCVSILFMKLRRLSALITVKVKRVIEDQPRVGYEFDVSDRKEILFSKRTGDYSRAYTRYSCLQLAPRASLSLRIGSTFRLCTYFFSNKRRIRLLFSMHPFFLLFLLFC